MLVIKNRLIPFGGYVCINLFGVVFTKCEMDERIKNHERIHTVQQLEMFGIGFLLDLVLCLMFGWSNWWLLLSLPTFYYWYGIEYLIKRFRHKRQEDAYRAISFEREAYANESKTDYVYERMAFAWWKFIPSETLSIFEDGEVR